MEVMISVGLFVVGAAMGSFGCCQAWRIRKGDRSRWSHCMGCGVRLRAVDNVPVVSWLVLRGRCRKCGGKIGWAEILGEVGMGVGFVFSYLLWPWGFEGWWGVVGFGVFLALLCGLLVLFVYDARWRELPMRVLTFCVICASIMMSLRVWWLLSDGNFSWGWVWGLAGAMAILPGLYFVLYKGSREKWMGGGDWWVALTAALVLQDWWLALCCVFVANFLGAVVGVAGKRRKMAFGPFLIVGLLVVFFAQGWLRGLVGV